MAFAGTSCAGGWRGAIWCIYQPLRDLIVPNILRPNLIYLLPQGHILPKFLYTLAWYGSNQSPLAYEISVQCTFTRFSSKRTGCILGDRNSW